MGGSVPKTEFLIAPGSTVFTRSRSPTGGPSCAGTAPPPPRLAVRLSPFVGLSLLSVGPGPLRRGRLCVQALHQPLR